VTLPTPTPASRRRGWCGDGGGPFHISSFLIKPPRKKERSKKEDRRRF